ncbi:MAG: cell surface protein SprA, partial [Muribaculaceae bacterium]|nr:cell surface protein SprA [Muribaculaceae bacterium]
FSFNKQKNFDPTTEYEYTNDYRGSLQYSYSPMIKPLKPFSWVKGKSKNAKFLREWQINWLFNNLTFLTSMTRYYYENQTRSEVDVDFRLPVQVSKNFYWNRQLSLTWNLIPSLSLSFNSNTTARIEETIGAVNKRLFPDTYRDWKDTVLSSIRGLGTPWNYNQTATGTYRAPFNKIAFLDYLTGSVTYTANYQWDRGATIDGVYLGNSITNQTSWNADGRINFETLYNKSKYLQRINKRFTSSSSSSRAGTRNNATVKKPQPKKFEKAYTLSMDTTTLVEHKLKTKKVKFKAMAAGKPISLQTRVVDENTIEILSKGKTNIKVTVTEDIKETKKSQMATDFADHTLRFLMMMRSASVRYRTSHSLNLPLFSPNVGDVFGQSTKYGPMAPGLDFAFGFYDESYVQKALDRNWLILDNAQVSPAIWNRSEEYNFELQLEPIRGLKITLTSNLTDSRTQQVQFMYAGMPTARTGSYTRTHVAIATALRGSKADNGYASEAFSRFLEYIPQVAPRYEAAYRGREYPTTGFM